MAAAAVIPAAAYEWNDSIRYSAQVGAAVGGGDHNPFWFASNKYGFSSVEKNNLWLRLGVFKDLDKSKRFSWGAGVDLGVAHRFSSVFVPQQLYAEVKYRCLNAMIGQKEMYDPMLDPELSSGALTQGINAHPIPQLRLGIFDYANFWGCKEWFAVKGWIGYGMFTDDWWLKRWANPEYRYSLGTLYATRAIYFRGGNAEKFPLEGELGLVMDTEFGGKTWIPNKNGGGQWEKHPQYLKAWVKAMIPMSGGADTNAGEQTNVEGNMLGNWSASLKWQDPSGWMVKVYYQHYFEDHSMLFFDYPWIDGLYGVQGKLPRNRILSDVVYEFFYQKDQSGSVYYDHTPTIDYQVSGRDNYYNHYIYNGWQNWGMSIGNPFFISPIYNSNHQIIMPHTRIRAHHLGLRGEPSAQLTWRVLLSYMQSWGTYDAPLRRVEDNFSCLAEIKYHPAKLKGWEGSLSFGMDAGSMLGHSYGAMITISKTGWFK